MLNDTKAATMPPEAWALAERLSETKARRVYLILRDRILSNALAPGARLPTEVDLARFHQVSRVTVRRALAELSREQLIERRRASGTRVTYRPPSKPMTADIANVLATLAEMGERTASKLLSFAYVPATGPVADALGVVPDEKLQRSVRVRSSDGMPFSYLVAHVPGRIGATYSRHELAAKPLLALLERSGVKIERASQRISAVLATPETARALKVKVGSPLVELVRVVYDSSGRGVEHLHALYRPDRYNLEMDLERSSDGGIRNWTPAVQGKHSRTTRRTWDTSRGKNSKCQTIN
jgi:GntR family transcriptional regulator